MIGTVIHVDIEIACDDKFVRCESVRAPEYQKFKMVG